MQKIAAGLAGLALAQAVAKYPTEDEMETMYQRFQNENPRSDNAVRYPAFKVNVKNAMDMNAEQNSTCTDLFDGEECVFGITKFSDMYQDEFAATHTGYKQSEKVYDAPVVNLDDLQGALANAAASVDWRTKGAVSAVKDQGQCGSCWAFSATEEIESAVFMATKKLPLLSTQQVISCDKVDEGCQGGNTETAYAFVEKNGGIDAAKDYPDKSHITAKNGKCLKKKEKDATVISWSHAVKQCTRGACKNQDETGLATVLATKGPISICVNAAAAGWQSYKRGIFSKKCGHAANDIDHCVQLVGYNKAGAKPYWIVRNSWNTNWGIKGYMHLEMGKNLCGVANDATLVVAKAGAASVVV